MPRAVAFWNSAQSFEAVWHRTKDIKPGVGVLVFCGNGFAWRLSDLRILLIFTAQGLHRADDMFGPMKKNHIERSGIKLARKIDQFGGLKRAINEPENEYHVPVLKAKNRIVMILKPDLFVPPRTRALKIRNRRFASNIISAASSGSSSYHRCQASADPYRNSGSNEKLQRATCSPPFTGRQRGPCRA